MLHLFSSSTKLIGPNIKRIIKNGTVIDLGSPSVSIRSVPSTSGAPGQAKIIYLNAPPPRNDKEEEESVSAIRSFLEETSAVNSTTIIDGKEVRVPAGIKITSAGKGVVNIRAIADSRSSLSTPKTSLMTSQLTVTPKSGNVGSVRGMKGVSMVTLTAGGIIKKVSEPKLSLSDTDQDEGDSDDLFDDDELEDFDGGGLVREKRPPVKRGPLFGAGRKRGRTPRSKDDDGDYRPTGSALKAKPKRIPILKQTTSTNSSPAATSTPVASAAAALPSDDGGQDEPPTAADSSGLDDSALSLSGEEPRGKRARKEKKIFDL